MPFKSTPNCCAFALNSSKAALSYAPLVLFSSVSNSAALFFKVSASILARSRS
jgi:hypothetical protein